MNKLSTYFLGPEILWLVFYLIVIIIIRLSKSPNPAMDAFWVNTAFIVPLVLIPLTFMIYFIPGVSHSWLLLRIWIAGLVGAHFVLSKGLGVHSEGGPGVGTAYIMGMGIVFVMLIAGSIFALIKFR